MNVKKKNIEFLVNEKTYTFPWWQSYSQWETFIFKCIDKYSGKTFIDIGAWNGAVTLYAAQKFQKIYAYEPDPVAYSDLLRNIEINDYKNIVPDFLAISDKTGQSVLYFTQLGDSMSSFIPNSKNWIGSHTDTLLNQIKIKGIKDIGLIKIDVEGGEKFIIPSIAKFIKKNKIPVHLSLHFMFLETKEVEKLLEYIKECKLLDENFKELTVGEILRKRISEILVC